MAIKNRKAGVNLEWVKNKTGLQSIQEIRNGNYDESR
jgi:hypothetical protein